MRLLGFIDRVDRAPDGRLRVVDYKTGKAPSPRYVDEALFQMRFYALLLARTQVLPSRMQLGYLSRLWRHHSPDATPARPMAGADSARLGA